MEGSIAGALGAVKKALRSSGQHPSRYEARASLRRLKCAIIKIELFR